MHVEGVFTFEIPGPPVPKERPRRGPAGNFYTPKRTVDYENTVAWAATAAKLELEPGKPYGIKLEFYMSHHSKDIDNCVKSVLDGLNRLPGGWDDRQIMFMEVHKRMVKDGADERAVVTIEQRKAAQ